MNSINKKKRGVVGIVIMFFSAALIGLIGVGGLVLTGGSFAIAANQLEKQRRLERKLARITPPSDFNRYKDRHR